MANQGPGTASPLAHVAARAKSVQRTRDNLGMNAVAPNSSQLSPATPPPTPPAASSPAANPAAPTDPNSREAMLARTQEVLAQSMNNGQPTAPPPEPVQSPTAPPAVGLDTRLSQLGATALSAPVQFQRLAGRPATGRELVVFAAYQQLSRELGRAPTRNELSYRVTTQPGAANIEPVM